MKKKVIKNVIEKNEMNFKNGIIFQKIYKRYLCLNNDSSN